MNVTDRQTDWRTDRRTTFGDITVLCRPTGLIWISWLFHTYTIRESGNQTQTCSSLLKSAQNACRNEHWGGVWRGPKNFHFLGLEMRILVHSLANLSRSIRVWAVTRPTPALRSVKKDRNGVPVRSGPKRTLRSVWFCTRVSTPMHYRGGLLDIALLTTL